ncbi:Na+/H+ antiporter NhaC [Pseudoxanthomonas wuyuanensis]|uniref:Transporter, NhaC family n=1 Tax=Pseudoxanthomonas wuyuanensis TaxID=1073196 RepID=A0A286CWB4_9GAMM|nr:Na+/H+ antiporter NhaC [Pseudoxanthomonas wuyuanensis]KAF1719154.1 Na+/H+ antiporter NhaC [Pseudoxanthomonas wuyuanensis]SOD50678.1 transporter, NhaC family [Pseudoxanthomonas wuyuanensis]
MKLETPRREPSLLQALTPLLFLMVLLALAVYLYADNASYGANQIALLLAGGVAALIGIRNGMSWRQIQESLVHGISLAVVPIFILLAVGALIGTWMLSGTVPTLIVYGLKLLHPSFFYPAACLICAIVALAIGSSWTVAGTLGVALIGVAQGLDMSLPITAGAVISGAYFGDKMSPLSDTTNIAPAAAGSELFAHIRHMTWTTVPSITIALLLFTAIGLGSGGRTDGDAALGDLPTTLAAQFNMGWHLLIPLIVVFALAVRRFPAYPTILIGALLGALFAVVFQPEAVLRLAGNDGLSRPMALLSGAWTAMFDGFKVETGNAAVDELLSRGGMSSMLNTVWLVVCAMGFGAVMESTGLLERMIRSVLKAARSTGSLIAATLGTAIGANVVAADQYMSIVLTGRLYRPEYERRGLAPVNLSRALEDAGTMTSPLIPWNTCGAYMAATLGVATLDYLPYVFFNLVSPLVAVTLAYAGFKILRVTPEPVIVHRE